MPLVILLRFSLGQSPTALTPTQYMIVGHNATRESQSAEAFLQCCMHDSEGAEAAL